jgi:putative addiction module component (TIGR02574 family)
MDTLTIRQKLYEYIRIADDEKVEAIYTIIKDDLTIKEDVSAPYEWWNDDDLVAELDRRPVDLKSGKDKGFTLEEVKERLLNKLK